MYLLDYCRLLQHFQLGVKPLQQVFSVLRHVPVLIILLSGLALISGESYITSIWK